MAITDPSSAASLAINVGLRDIAFDTSVSSPPEHHPQSASSAAHFSDILGQTLAGPLFATWSPTPPVVNIAKPIEPNANVASLDANGRRDSRKRSRR